MNLSDFIKEREKKKTSNGSASGSSKPSGKGSREKTLADYIINEYNQREDVVQRREKAANNVLKWLGSYNSAINGYRDYEKTAFDQWDMNFGGEWYEKVLGLRDEYDNIRNDANLIGSSYKDAYDYLNELADTIQKNREYMAQFDSDEGYQTHRKQEAWYQKYQNLDYNRLEETAAGIADPEEQEFVQNMAGNARVQRLRNMDITMAQTDVGQLKRQRDQVYDGFDWTDSASRAQAEKEGKADQYNAIDSRIAQLEADITQAKRYQKEAELSGVGDRYSQNYDPEFAQRAQFRGDSALSRMINETDAERAWRKQQDDVWGASDFSQKGYDRLEPEEKDTYNYWDSYDQQNGTQKAMEYLDSLLLEERVGTENYEQSKDYNRALKMLAYGMVGMEGAFKGMSNLDKLLFGKEDYTPASPTQIAANKLLQDDRKNGHKMGGLGKYSPGNLLQDEEGGRTWEEFFGQGAMSIGNMVPSMAVAGLLNMALPGLGFGVKATAGLSRAGSLAVMGAGIAGNTYTEAINQGYDPSNAKAYAYANAASEIGTELLFGGIEGMTGIGTDALGKKLLSMTDNAILRAGARGVVDGLGETVEEGFQAVIEPWMNNVILHKDEVLRGQDVAYNMLAGFATGFMMSALSIALDEYGTYRTGKDALGQNIDVDTLRGVGESFDIGTEANRLAGKIDKNTGAYTIGRTLNEIGAGLGEQNVRDISRYLQNHGLPADVAENNAMVLNYIAMGGELSEQQKLMVNENQLLADAVREVILNPESKVNQRTNGLKKLMGSGETSDAPEAAKIVSRRNENGDAALNNPNRAVLAVTSREGDTMQLRLKNGDVVDSSDMTAYHDEREALLFETARKYSRDVADANLIANGFEGSNVSMEEYCKGVEDRYRYGLYGMNYSEVKRGSMSSAVDADAARSAYMAGIREANTRVARQQKAAMEARQPGQEAALHFNRNGRKFDAKRETAIATMEQLSKALGVDFWVFESYEKNGSRVYADETGAEHKAPNGWYDEYGIHIDLNAGNDGRGVMLYTLAHELTHHIRKYSPEKFKAFADLVMNGYGDRDISAENLIQKQITKAKKNGRDISYDEAYEEMIADSMEGILADGKVLEKLKGLQESDPSLWETVKQWAKDVAEKIRAIVDAYKGERMDSTEGKIVSNMKEILPQLEELYAEGLADTRVTAVTDGGTKNAAKYGGVKYSLRAFEDGTRFVDVQMDAHTFDGMAVSEMNKSAKKILMDKFAGRIIGIDNRVFVNGDSVNEYLHPSKSIDAQTRKAKLTASGELDNLLDAGIALPNEPDGKDGHIHPDAIDFSYFKTIFKVGSEYFEGIVNVKNIKRGKLLKDVTKIRNITEDIVSSYGQNPKSNFLRDASMCSIRSTDGKVNKKFSMRDTVEETKNLVALHNLTEDKLQKALDLGGFPMPSIAVTKSDIPHTNFGDITLVFGRETIDPKASRKNTVYSADAWTPTFPQIEYEINDKVGNAAHRRLRSLEIRIDEHFRRDLGRVEYSMSDTLNRYGGEEGFIQYAIDNYGMKAAYLEEHGQHIEPQTKQEKTGVEVTPAMEDKYVKIMDVLGVYDPSEIGNLVLKDVRQQHGAELEEVYPGITKTAFRLGNVLSRIKDWLSGNTGTEYKTVTDVEETKKFVDSVLDTAKYEAWVRGMFSGIEKDSGVYNGKDRYTPSGNVRSFKATHISVTLDGIVKAMAAQNGGNTKNVAGFNGIKTLRAGTAERFSSIEAMHRNEGRLQNLSQEQLDQVQDALSDRMFEVMKRIDDETMNKHGGSNPLIRYDAIGDIMMEIAEGRKYNVSDIQKIFQKYTMDISDETAVDVKTLLFDVSQMPVNLFEAKPERSIRFDEVKAAIVPKGTDQKIVDRLNDYGVPVKFYTGDNERLELVNSVEDAKFSDRDPDVGKMNQILQKQNAELKDTVEYLRELVKLQGKVTDGTVYTWGSVEAAARRLMNGAGAKGDVVELRKILEKTYKAMGEGSENMTGLIDEAAQWLVDHKPEAKPKLDSYAQGILSEIKGRGISLNDSQKAEAAHLVGKYGDYRRRFFGTLNISDTANTSLDQFWQEMSGQYPDIFNPDISSSDMPRELYSAIDTLKSMFEESAFSPEELAEAALNEQRMNVWENFTKLVPIKTTADRNKAQVESIKQRYTEKIQSIRENYQSQIDQLKQQRREDVNAVRAEMQGKADAQQQAAKERFQQQKEDLKAARQDTQIIEREFLRLARECDKAIKAGDTAQSRADSLKAALEAETKKHKQDNAMWEKEFQRLFREYEKADRNVDALQEKLDKTRASAKARVEDRKQTAIRNQLKDIHGKLQKMILNPGKGVTAHAPTALTQAVADVCDLFVSNLEQAAVRRSGEYDARIDMLSGKLAENHELKYAQNGIDAAQRQKARIADKEIKLGQLRQRYEEIKKDGALSIYYDEHTSQMLEALDKQLRGKDIYDMTSQELEAVKETMQSFYHSIVNANKIWLGDHNAELTETARQWGKEINGVNVGFIRKYLKPVGRYMNWQMSPDTMFMAFSGYAKNSVGEQVQKMFSKGTERMIQVQTEYYNQFSDIMENPQNRKELGKLLGNPTKTLVDVGLKDMNGNSVKITRGMALQLYMLLCQEDSRKALVYSGLKVPDQRMYYKDRSKAYGDKDLNEMLTPGLGDSAYDLSRQIEDAEKSLKRGEFGGLSEEAFRQNLDDMRRQRDNLVMGEEARLLGLRNTIEGMLTPLERKCIESGRKWYARSGELMADTHEEIHGYRPRLIEDYVPMHRNGDTVWTDIRDSNSAFNLENSGFLKERVENRNAILLTDFFVELGSQRDAIARYCGYSKAQKDFSRLWKIRMPGMSSSVNEMIGAKFGKGNSGLGVSGVDYVENYIKDIAGGRESGRGLLDKFYGAAASASLSLNPRVAVSQLASIPTAAAAVGWKNMGVGFAKGLKTAFSKDAKNALAQKNAFFFQRYRGEGGITEVADLTQKNGLWNRISQSKAGKLLFNWCQNMDVFATSTMYAMAEEAAVSRGYKRGESGFDEAANEIYTEIIRRTQPNYTVTERSDMLRDNRAHMKMFNMFKTQSNQNLNILMQASGKFAKMRQDFKAGRNGVTRADVKQAAIDLANAGTAVIIGGAGAFVLMRTAVNLVWAQVKGYRDDETGEVTSDKIKEGMFQEFLSSMAGMFTLGDMAYELVHAAVSGERYYGLTDSAVGAVGDAIQDLMDLWQKSQDEEGWDEQERKKDIRSTIGSVFGAFGVPAENAMKFMDAYEHWVLNIQNGSLGNYDDSDTTKAQYRNRFLNAYRAGDADTCNDILALLAVTEDEPNKRRAAIELRGGFRDSFKDKFLNGEVTEEEVRDIMVTYLDAEPEDVELMIAGWKGKQDTGMTLDEMQDSYLREKVSTEDYIQYLTKYQGKDQEKAEEAELRLRCERDTGYAYDEIKQAYMEDEITASDAAQWLGDYGKVEDPDKKLKEYDFEDETGYSWDDKRMCYLDGGVSKSDFKRWLMDIDGKRSADADYYIGNLDFEKENGYAYNEKLEKYISGEISRQQLKQALMTKGGMFEAEADRELVAYDYIKNHPNTQLSISTAYSYTRKINNCDYTLQSAGFTEEQFLSFREKKNACNGTDSDGDGYRDSGSVQAQVLPIIDAMPISEEQKDTLWFFCGWSKKTLNRKAPWKKR